MHTYTLQSKFVSSPNLDHRYNQTGWTSDGEILTGWPRGGGSSSEMPLSLIVLGFSWLMWNPFSPFEYALSGKKRSSLEASLPSVWQEASDSKWQQGSSTDEISISTRPPSVVPQWLHFLSTGLQFLHSVFVICGEGLDAAAVISGLQTLVDEIVRWTSFLFFTCVTPNRVVDTRETC